MTKRENILAAVMACLTGVTGVSDEAIYRSRVSALLKDELPAIVVEPVSDACQREAVGRLMWSLTFQAIIVFRSETPDTDADATIADVHEKIMSDASLDGMLVDLLPLSVSWQFGDTDTKQVQVTMQFQADYQTDTRDISA